MTGNPVNLQLTIGFLFLMPPSKYKSQMQNAEGRGIEPLLQCLTHRCSQSDRNIHIPTPSIKHKGRERNRTSLNRCVQLRHPTNDIWCLSTQYAYQYRGFLPFQNKRESIRPLSYSAIYESPFGILSKFISLYHNITTLSTIFSNLIIASSQEDSKTSL